MIVIIILLIDNILSENVTLILMNKLLVIKVNLTISALRGKLRILISVSV